MSGTNTKQTPSDVPNRSKIQLASHKKTQNLLQLKKKDYLFIKQVPFIQHFKNLSIFLFLKQYD